MRTLTQEAMRRSSGWSIGDRELMLLLLRKPTREHRVEANDVRAVLAAGVSREQLAEALAVGFTFNTVDRPSRAFGWTVRVRRRSGPVRSSCSRAAMADDGRGPSGRRTAPGLMFQMWNDV